MPRLKIHRYPTTKPFVGGKDNTTYETHYRFTGPNNGSCYVAIHIGCYYTGLDWLNKLYEHLKTQIPFEAMFEKPEVEILGGPRYKRMPSVKVRINFMISEFDAHNKLVSAGFFQGLESL